MTLDLPRHIWHLCRDEGNEPEWKPERMHTLTHPEAEDSPMF